MLETCTRLDGDQINIPKGDGEWVNSRAHPSHLREVLQLSTSTMRRTLTRKEANNRYH